MRRTTERGITLIELLVAVSLLSLLSVGMLFAMRVGLDAMGKTNQRMIANRRVLGVDRILTAQIAGFIPTRADCLAAPDAPPARVPFFQGEPQTMRFVSTFSLNEATRGYPQILEFQVIPGENGQGVRLIVNELRYTGPRSTGATCLGVASDPGGRRILFRPVEAGPHSFVLADKLARCELSYKEEIQNPNLPDLWHRQWRREKSPAAVRIDLLPLEPDPAKLQVPSVVAPLRPTRDPLTVYYDVG
jgi:general secretion pathway protein J